MIDVQKQKPKYPVEINRVGIKEIQYPIRVQKKSIDFQSSIATIKISVKLPKSMRGTHMSRFVSLIEKHKHDINGKAIKEILKDTKTKFNCDYANIKITFPFFIEKRAPVSRISSILKTSCGYENILDNNKINSKLLVEVPVTTLCPCSKEISKYGAHNQRATIRLEIGEKDFIWFEDIIDIVEQCASAPIYSLLKREDEKFVTEQAYDNPKFVEDLVREIYTKMIESYKGKITSLKIEVESDESIHQHKAFAVIDKEVIE